MIKDCNCYVIKPQSLEIVSTDAIDDTPIYDSLVAYKKGALRRFGNGIYLRLKEGAAGIAPASSPSDSWGWLPSYASQIIRPQLSTNTDFLTIPAARGDLVNTGHWYVDANFKKYAFFKGYLYKANKDTNARPPAFLPGDPPAPSADWDYLRAYAPSTGIYLWADTAHSLGDIVWDTRQNKAFIALKDIAAASGLEPPIMTDDNPDDFWEFQRVINNEALLDTNPDNRMTRKDSLSVNLTSNDDYNSLSLVNISASDVSLKVNNKSFPIENPSSDIVLDNIDGKKGDVIELNLSNPGADAAIGNLIKGNTQELGATLEESNISVLTNDTVKKDSSFDVKRSLQRNRYAVSNDFEKFDEMGHILADIAGNPSLWIGVKKMETLTAYGVLNGSPNISMKGSKAYAKVDVLSRGIFRSDANIQIIDTKKPVTKSDSFTVGIGTTTVLNVLSNDANVQNIEFITQPAHGTATLSNNNISFVADAAYVGADAFSYVVKYEGKDIITSVVINTIDVTPPVVTLNAPTPINAASVNTYTLSGTCDQAEGDVTIILSGIYSTVTPVAGVWTATFNTAQLVDGSEVTISASQTDANSNTGSVQGITYKDVTSPVVILNGDTASVALGSTFNDPGVTATDSHDGDVSASIVVAGTVDTATAGMYELSYAATDAAGNQSAVIKRIVNVVDLQLDNIDLSTVETAQFRPVGIPLQQFAISINSAQTDIITATGQSSGVAHYRMSVAGDITTLQLMAQKNLVAQGDCRYVYSDDGLNLYIVNGRTNGIEHWLLTSKYDVASATKVSEYARADRTQAVALSSDKTKIFWTLQNTRDLFYADLTTPGDLTTVANVASVQLSTSIGQWDAVAMSLSSDGKRLLIGEYSDKNINQFDLATANDVSTMTIGQVLTAAISSVTGVAQTGQYVYALSANGYFIKYKVPYKNQNTLEMLSSDTQIVAYSGAEAAAAELKTSILDASGENLSVVSAKTSPKSITLVIDKSVTGYSVEYSLGGVIITAGSDYDLRRAKNSFVVQSYNYGTLSQLTPDTTSVKSGSSTVDIIPKIVGGVAFKTAYFFTGFINIPGLPNLTAAELAQQNKFKRVNAVGSGFQSSPSHGFHAWMEPSKFGAAHPEWYVGELSTPITDTPKNGNWNLDLTNTAMMEQYAQELFKGIKKKIPRQLSLAANDHFDWRKNGAQPSVDELRSNYWLFVTTVANRVHELCLADSATIDRADTLISMIAYHEFLVAPVGVVLPDNIIAYITFELSQIVETQKLAKISSIVDSWKPVCGVALWNYEMGGGRHASGAVNYPLPRLNLHGMKNYMQYLDSKKITAYYVEAETKSDDLGDFCRLWINAQLTSNHNANVDDLIKVWSEGIVGVGASQDLIDLINFWESHELKLEKHWLGASPADSIYYQIRLYMPFASLTPADVAFIDARHAAINDGANVAANAAALQLGWDRYKSEGILKYPFRDAPVAHATLDPANLTNVNWGGNPAGSTAAKTTLANGSVEIAILTDQHYNTEFRQVFKLAFTIPAGKRRIVAKVTVDDQVFSDQLSLTIRTNWGEPVTKTGETVYYALPDKNEYKYCVLDGVGTDLPSGNYILMFILPNNYVNYQPKVNSVVKAVEILLN